MSTLFQDTLDQALAFWKSQGVAYNSGASPAAIRALEQAYDMSFDASFTAYLRRANGFVDFDWDSAMFSFWSTERIA